MDVGDKSKAFSFNVDQSLVKGLFLKTKVFAKRSIAGTWKGTLLRKKLFPNVFFCSNVSEFQKFKFAFLESKATRTNNHKSYWIEINLAWNWASLATKDHFTTILNYVCEHWVYWRLKFSCYHFEKNFEETDSFKSSKNSLVVPNNFYSEMKSFLATEQKHSCVTSTVRKSKTSADLCSHT